jgi:hypothetical protein
VAPTITQTAKRTLRKQAIITSHNYETTILFRLGSCIYCVLPTPRSYYIVFRSYAWCLLLLCIRTSVLCYVYDIVLPLLYVLG